MIYLLTVYKKDRCFGNFVAYPEKKIYAGASEQVKPVKHVLQRKSEAI